MQTQEFQQTEPERPQCRDTKEYLEQTLRTVADQTQPHRQYKQPATGQDEANISHNLPRETHSKQIIAQLERQEKRG